MSNDSKSVQELIQSANAPDVNYVDLAKDIESALVSLHGDLRSIQRQLDLRETTRKIGSKFNENHNDREYDDWLRKIHRAYFHKKEQVRVLEKTLGKVREHDVDKKYIFVGLLLEIAIAANELEADMEENKDITASRAESRRLLDIMDKSWPDWLAK